MSSAKNLVFINRAVYNPETDELDSVDATLDKFTKYGDVSLTNLVSPDQESMRVRLFPTEINVLGRVYYPFGVQIARKYDSTAVNSFYEKCYPYEFIDYKGNYIGSGLGQPEYYHAFDFDEVLDGRADLSVITDKIVILGFLGYELGNQYSGEDKYETPLNLVYSGSTNSDMHGAVIHANIASMILDYRYVDEISQVMGWTLLIVISLVNVALFLWIENKIPLWFQPLTKLIQITQILLLVYGSIVLFRDYDYFLFSGPIILFLALVGDALEIHLSIIKRLITSTGRGELFRIQDESN